MIPNYKQLLFVLFLAVAASALAANATAQCSTCGVPAHSYQTYSPVTYTTYRASSGWYPGYWADRARFAWWGGGYTTAYAPTYTTGYRPAYYANYAPTYSTYYRPVYYAGYATSYSPTSACSSCSTCTTCYSPSCCDPCSSCSTCSTGGVSQAVYQDSGCSTCGVVQSSATSSPSTYRNDTRPELAPNDDPASERSVNKPSEEGEINPVPPQDEFNDSALHFEAPQLFSPTDQTAQKNAAPVRTAEYHLPVTGQRSQLRNISVSVTREQAIQDSAGWTSVSP